MKLLTREQIVNAKDIKSVIVPCPEWGGSVSVQGLTLEEKDEWSLSISEDKGVSIKGATAKLCALCMRGDKGKLLFSLDDIEVLQAKSALPMDRIFQAAQELTGIGQGEVEEAVKNSEKTPTEGSD